MLDRSNSSNKRSYPLSKDPGQLRVLSFNIRIDHVDDRGNHHCWSKRREIVAELFHTYAPDIAALQEVDSNQLDDLRKLLPRYAMEGFPAGSGHPGEERLLFCYDTSCLTLLEAGVFSLSPTPDKPVRAWDARYPRAFVYGKFLHQPLKTVFAVFNTHFDHVGEVARLEGAKVLLKYVNSLAHDIPLLVLGDFNCLPHAGGQELYSLFVEPSTGLQDVRDLIQEQHYGPDGTWIGWEYEAAKAPEGVAGYRIDHLFVRGSLSIIRAGVLPFSVDESGRVIDDYFSVNDALRRFPSDHLPLIADLELTTSLARNWHKTAML